MKRHTTVAAFVLALAAYSLGQQSYRESQDHQDQTATTQPATKLSKKDRKKLEKEEKKEEKKAREEERKEAKDLGKKQAEEQRKQYKEQEKRAAKERKREQKEEEKQVAAERKKQEKYDRKDAERAEKEEARDMHRHVEHEARDQRAASSHVPRYAYVARIPVSSTATPGLLLAQRNVSRAIYSQLPTSDVRVLVGSGSQLVLRGSAPSPSWRQRLLQLAMGAASGYSIVDQLASNLVGDAASAATSAAIGGVSSLIHGSGVKDGGPESSYAPPPDSPAQSPAYSQPALPNSDSEPMVSALDPGSNACVNLSKADQALLTGQVSSQPSAELIRRFARQLASPSALVTDQLAVRSSGAPAASNAPQDPANSSSEGSITGKSPSQNSSAIASSPATVSPGSTVCVTENNGAVLVTGTVGSTADLGIVENAIQPLVGSGRLLDHLTIASTNASTNSGVHTIASSSPSTVVPTPPGQQSDVEQALHSIPRLANVNVQVASDGVHLSGSVDTTQDDQMAMDVAHEYAPGRPVLDNLAIANRAQPPQQ